MAEVYGMSILVGGVFLLFYLAFLLGVYVLTQFGLYRMARHAGIPGAWLAFVPIGSGYITGLLAERAVYTYTGQRRRLALWNTLLPAVTAAGVILIVILALADSPLNAGVWLGLIAMLVGGIVGFVVFCYSLYYIFKDYAPDNAVLFTLLGIFLGIYWIFFLVVMNAVPVSVTGFGVYPYGRPKYDKYHQWPQTPPDQPGYGPYGPQGGYGGYPGQGYGQGQSSPYTTRPQDYAGGRGSYPPPGGFGGMGAGYDPAHPERYAPPAQGPAPGSQAGSQPNPGAAPSDPPADAPREEKDSRGPEL